MRKTKKHKVYSIEEKNQIVLLYLDKHIGMTQLVRDYDIASRSVVQRWVKQYLENGTCLDGRRATKLENPRKGRPRKTLEKTLEEMTKEELIERVRMLEDIKKSLACLDEQRRKSIK